MEFLYNNHMKNSKVYFTDLRTVPGNDMLTKLERLIRKAGIADIDFDVLSVQVVVFGGLVLQLLVKLLLSFRNNVYTLCNFV